jgi:uncharacterized protein (DUF4415 family)
MSEKRTVARIRKADVPYNPRDKAATLDYWAGATAHHGVAELRARRGRPAKSAADRKEQIALRVDKDVLDWYRAQGKGWQTRMNAVLKAYRDATV